MMSTEDAPAKISPATESVEIPEDTVTENTVTEKTVTENTDSPPPTAESPTPAEAPADSTEPAQVEVTSDGGDVPAPAADDRPADPQAESDDSGEPTTAAEPVKQLPRLNPTFVAAKPRPVTSIDGADEPAESAAATTSETEAAATAETSAMKPLATVEEVPAQPTSEPVDIPAASLQLDPETEAELAAALAAGDLDPAASVATESTADELSVPSEQDLPPEEELEKGTKLTGKIQSIHGDDVFFDIGYRSPGVVQLRQFTASKKPLVGQILEIVVEKVDSDEGLILLNLPRGIRKSAGNWDTVAVGQNTDCMVVNTNKGGLEVTVGSLRGFLPASQVDLGFVSDLSQYVGQKLTVQITEVNQKKRRLIVSRRTILQLERKDLEAELWTKLAVGQTLSGKVKTIKDYGAFVDIGGTDGFLHIGEISHSRIRHPSDVISEGQQVEVQILKLEPEKKKISLGMKQLVQDPWIAVTSNYPADSTVTGKVTRVADFGAFVELEPGVEGMVHVSEISHTRVHRVSDVLKTGQEIEAKVLEADPDRKRISLSIKALIAKPADKSRRGAAEKPVEPYERINTGPLKGGTSDSLSKPGGGLFGNPTDFGR